MGLIKYRYEWNKIYSFVEILDNMEAVELAIDGLDLITTLNSKKLVENQIIS